MVWDESTMANKGGPEALDRTLRDFRADESPMGGVVKFSLVIFGKYWQLCQEACNETKQSAQLCGAL